MGRFSGNTCRLITMMILTSSYFLVELVVGHVTNSISLIADSFHMLSDIVALIVGVSAIRISKWPRSSKNTFGWQRAEVLGTLVNTIVLVTLCFTILVEAIQRYVKQEAIEQPILMVGVGAGGLVVNLIGLGIFAGSGGHGHSHGLASAAILEEEIEPLEDDLVEEPEANNRLENATTSKEMSVNGDTITPVEVKLEVANVEADEEEKKKKKKKKSGGGHGHSHGGNAGQMNMRAVFLHVLADALGSVIVIISACIIWLAPGDIKKEGYWKVYIDPSMSIIMVLIISKSAIPLMYKAALILLQSVPKEICLKKLKHRLETIDGIHKIHDLHVWKLQSNCIIGTVHIRCKNLPDYIKVAREVKDLFHEFDIHCTTIQPEFEEHVDENDIDYQQCVLDCGPNKSCQSDTCCPAPTLKPNGTGPTDVRVVPSDATVLPSAPSSQVEEMGQLSSLSTDAPRSSKVV